MPKRSRSIKNTRLLIGGAAVALIVIIAIQAFAIKVLYDRTDQLALQPLNEALINAVKGVSFSPVEDSQTGRHHIPAYRIVFPAKLETQLYYAGGEDSYVWLSSANVQTQAIANMRSAQSPEAVFKQVAILQKCRRQITISFNVQNPEAAGDDKLTLINTKKLKDGRTAYIYQNDCPIPGEPLLRTVDQVESY